MSDNTFEFDLQPSDKNGKKPEQGRDRTTILTVIICLIVAGVVSLFVWKPSLPFYGVTEIRVSLDGKTTSWNESDGKKLDEITKEIKSIFKGSSFSAFISQKSDEKITDTYADDAFADGAAIIEIKQRNSKYAKIAFKFNQIDDAQKITVLATRSDSYEKAEVKVFNNCRLKKFINVLRGAESGN